MFHVNGSSKVRSFHPTLNLGEPEDQNPLCVVMDVNRLIVMVILQYIHILNHCYTQEANIMLAVFSNKTKQNDPLVPYSLLSTLISLCIPSSST